MNYESEYCSLWDPFEIQYQRQSNSESNQITPLVEDCSHKGITGDESALLLNSNDIIFDDWDLAWQVPEDICDWDISDPKLMERVHQQFNNIDSNHSLTGSKCTSGSKSSGNTSPASSSPISANISRKRKLYVGNSDCQESDHIRNTRHDNEMNISSQRYHPLDNLKIEKNWTVNDYQIMLADNLDRIGKVRVYSSIYCIIV